MLTLYQFPLSHYCEKIAWALDYKGLSYKTVDLLPGAHMFAVRRLAKATTVPVLIDGEHAVQDSTVILNYLDRHYPQNPLTPHDPALKRMAITWEERLDDEVGPHLRRWGYYHLLREAPAEVLRVYLLGQSSRTKKFYPIFFPLVRVLMRLKMSIWKKEAEKSFVILSRIMTELEEVLAQRKFLVGDTFTRADLTACSLFYPMVRPKEHPLGEAQIEFSGELAEHSKQWQDSRLFNWVREMYRNYRKPQSV